MAEAASIVWLGEGKGGPEENTWNGHVFRVGEPVEISDPRMIAKAKTNRFYEVNGERSGETLAEGGDDLDSMKIAELRELADQRGIDHTDMSKAELREALRT